MRFSRLSCISMPTSASPPIWMPGGRADTKRMWLAEPSKAIFSVIASLNRIGNISESSRRRKFSASRRSAMRRPFVSPASQARSAKDSPE